MSAITAAPTALARVPKAASLRRPVAVPAATEAGPASSGHQSGSEVSIRSTIPGRCSPSSRCSRLVEDLPGAGGVVVGHHDQGALGLGVARPRRRRSRLPCAPSSPCATAAARSRCRRRSARAAAAATAGREPAAAAAERRRRRRRRRSPPAADHPRVAVVELLLLDHRSRAAAGRAVRRSTQRPARSPSEPASRSSGASVSITSREKLLVGSGAGLREAGVGDGHGRRTLSNRCAL